MRTNSYGVPLHVRQRMYDILACALDSLLPPDIPAERVIKPHVWYDAFYVGKHQGQVVRWVGWYANLKPIFKCCSTIYFDYVPNVLSHEENLRLFGEQFAQAIQGLDAFVCLFMTACSLKVQQELIEEGYIVRVTEKRCHPAVISQPHTLDSLSDEWVGHVLKMQEVYRTLCSKCVSN